MKQINYLVPIWIEHGSSMGYTNFAHFHELFFFLSKYKNGETFLMFFDWCKKKKSHFSDDRSILWESEDEVLFIVEFLYMMFSAVLKFISAQASNQSTLKRKN